MYSSYFVFLIHITICYSKQYQSNYTLTPLAHGYYFSNSPKVNWYTARKNCLFYNLELASIFDEEDYLNIQDAFLIHPIWDTFIGDAQGLFLSAVGKQPWDPSAFAWDVNGTNYPLVNYDITKKLWAPKQPDNNDPLEQCVSVYLLSDEDVRLGLNDIQCGWLRGFLCEIITPPGIYIPPPPNYTLTTEHNKTGAEPPPGNHSNPEILVLRQATWAKAVQECAHRNKTLPILSTQSAIDYFIHVYYDGGYLDPSEAIWTSASSLGELAAADLKKMPNAMKFRWPDHRYYEDIHIPKEQCLAYSKDRGFFEESCMENHTFVCKKPESAKTPCHDIQFDTIHIDKRTFHYSNNALLTWGEALMCCASREQRLISIATPIVGNLLSHYFQTTKGTVGRHTGFKYGVWTSGNLLSEYEMRYNTTYEFASSYERIELEHNGVNHYMQGPRVFNGECLQFVVEDGLTHSYILSNISCDFFRSFVCEEGEKFKLKDTKWLTDPEDPAVVYVNSTATWQEAYLACASANMSLLTVESEEENKKALNILKAAQSSEEAPWMIWMGGTRLLGITIHREFIWMGLNRTVTYSKWIHGQPDYFYPHEWCMNGAAKDGEFVWDDIDCQQKMHFMCRMNNLTVENETFDDALLPIDRGYYVPEFPNKTYAEGVIICEDNEYELATLGTHTDYLDIQSVLMFSADPFWQLFVNTSNAYFLDIQFNNYTLSAENWPEGLPAPLIDPATPPSECFAAYLKSRLTPKLVLKVVNCEDLRGFICTEIRFVENIEWPGERELTSALQISEETTVSSISRISNILPPPENREYFVVSNKDGSHWYAGRKACVKANGELASIRSEAEMLAIENLLKSEKQKESFRSYPEFLDSEKGLWVSAVCSEKWSKNGFRWTVEGKQYPLTNYPVSEKLWAPGSPDNKDPMEQCTVIFLMQKGATQVLAMDDVVCRLKRGWICVRNSGETPPTTPTIPPTRKPTKIPTTTKKPTQISTKNPTKKPSKKPNGNGVTIING